MELKTKKIKMQAEYVREFIKSPECLFEYLYRTWKKYGRTIYVDDTKDMFAYVECPSIDNHGVTESCYPNAYASAKVVRERGTGKGYLHCDICGGTWDLIGLFAHDHYLTRAEAIRVIENAMRDRWEIVDGVKFEEVDNIQDMGARESRLVINDFGNLCALGNLATDKAEWEQVKHDTEESLRAIIDKANASGELSDKDKRLVSALQHILDKCYPEAKSEAAETDAAKPTGAEK